MDSNTIDYCSIFCLKVLEICTCQISQCEKTKRHKPFIDWPVVRLPRTIIRTDHKFLLSYLTTQYQNPSQPYTWKRCGNAEHKQVLLSSVHFISTFLMPVSSLYIQAWGKKKNQLIEIIENHLQVTQPKCCIASLHTNMGSLAPYS